jgi:excisionase family DNA binding protein
MGKLSGVKTLTPVSGANPALHRTPEKEHTSTPSSALPSGQSSSIAGGLLTPREIADLLRCSPPHVLRLMRKGIIPAAFSVGRVHRFDPVAVLAALAGRSAVETQGRGRVSGHE